MRKTLLLSAAALALTAGPALAQSQTIRPGHVPGVGDSQPASSQASNIDSADARSTIAPRLPEPAGGPSAGPDHYIRDAQRALAHHQTGMAQQAIEMAETRLLDRSVLATAVNTPADNPAITALEAARHDLAKHDWTGANRHLSEAIIQSADAMPMAGSSGMSPGMSGSSPAAMSGSGMSNGMPAGTSGGMGNGAGMTGATAPSSPGSTAPGESDGMNPPASPTLQP